jgi:hypothetical protein
MYLTSIQYQVLCHPCHPRSSTDGDDAMMRVTGNGIMGRIRGYGGAIYAEPHEPITMTSVAFVANFINCTASITTAAPVLQGGALFVSYSASLTIL